LHGWADMHHHHHHRGLAMDANVYPLIQGFGSAVTTRTCKIATSTLSGETPRSAESSASHKFLPSPQHGLMTSPAKALLSREASMDSSIPPRAPNQIHATLSIQSPLMDYSGYPLTQRRLPPATTPIPVTTTISAGTSTELLSHQVGESLKVR